MQSNLESNPEQSNDSLDGINLSYRTPRFLDGKAEYTFIKKPIPLTNQMNEASSLSQQNSSFNERQAVRENGVRFKPISASSYTTTGKRLQNDFFNMPSDATWPTFHIDHVYDESSGATNNTAALNEMNWGVQDNLWQQGPHLNRKSDYAILLDQLWEDTTINNERALWKKSQVVADPQIAMKRLALWQSKGRVELISEQKYPRLIASGARGESKITVKNPAQGKPDFSRNQRQLPSKNMSTEPGDQIMISFKKSSIDTGGTDENQFASRLLKIKRALNRHQIQIENSQKSLQQTGGDPSTTPQQSLDKKKMNMADYLQKLRGQDLEIKALQSTHRPASLLEAVSVIDTNEVQSEGLNNIYLVAPSQESSQVSKDLPDEHSRASWDSLQLKQKAAIATRVSKVLTIGFRDSYINALHILEPVYVSEEEIDEKQVYLSRQNVKRKTLVLDLDETLIHSITDIDELSVDCLTVYEQYGSEYRIKVKKRPFLDYFLEIMSQNYEIIVFTASNRDYADTVIKQLDPNNKYFSNRLYRYHCIERQVLDTRTDQLTTIYVKDLRLLENRDLKDIIIVDNSIESFANQIDNAIPILPFLDDEADRQLMYLADLLLVLKDVDDVTTVLQKQLQLKELLFRLY